MSATTTRTRKIHPEVHGVVRWVSVSSVTFRIGAIALLSINGAIYGVKAIKDGARIVGYQLSKGDKSYDIDLTPASGRTGIASTRKPCGPLWRN